jgi:biopolymer transport protein ExbD
VDRSWTAANASCIAPNVGFIIRAANRNPTKKGVYYSMNKKGQLVSKKHRKRQRRLKEKLKTMQKQKKNKPA